MPRFYPRPIIKRDKHEITWSALSEDASSVKAITISTCVAVADKDASTETSVGSHVKSVYFETNLSAETTTAAKIMHWTLEIIIPGGTGTTPSTYYQNQRSQIIKRGMDMLVRDQSTLIKRMFVVRIPKIYQRQKMGQVLQLRYVSTSANTQNFCGMAIYKELY